MLATASFAGSCSRVVYTMAGWPMCRCLAWLCGKPSPCGSPHPHPPTPIASAASVARKLYFSQGIGVGAFRKKYGGRNKRNGAVPEHYARAAGGLIRHILKQVRDPHSPCRGPSSQLSFAARSTPDTPTPPPPQYFGRCIHLYTTISSISQLTPTVAAAFLRKQAMNFCCGVGSWLGPPFPYLCPHSLLINQQCGAGASTHGRA